MSDSFASGRARLGQLVLFGHADPAARPSARPCSRSIRSAAPSTTSPTIRGRATARHAALEQWRTRSSSRSMPDRRRRSFAGLARAVQRLRSRSMTISSPSSTAWRWTSSPISARRTCARSIFIATASPARSAGFRCASSAWRAKTGIALAHHLGRALQLTNILRDLDEDAALGRLYLPREALREAGIIIDRSGRGDRTIRRWAKPARRSSLWRAPSISASARAIMAELPRQQVRAPRIMGEAYRLILQRPGRARLGAAARAGAAAKARFLSASCCAISSERFFDDAHGPHHRCRPCRACPRRSSSAGAATSVVVHEATAVCRRPLPLLSRCLRSA